jgi:hypothetical protein
MGTEEPVAAPTRTWRTAMGIANLIIAIAAAGTFAASAVAAPPRVVAGWPRNVAAGTVHQGPGGGLVVISIGDVTLELGAQTVSAFRRDGRRLWSARRAPGCGNCDDGPQPASLQADGTYGPIGVEGDDFWAVDARGRIVTGCAGVVYPDGACVVGGSQEDAARGDSPAITGRPAAAPPWVVRDDRYGWRDEFQVPPMTVRDRAGLVYAAFEAPTDRTTGRRLLHSGLLMAVDPKARTILWTRVGPTQVLTGLGSGVLVKEAAGITAIGADGSVTWSRGLSDRQRVVPGRVVYDAARGRVYIGRVLGSAPPGVTALVARTGAQVWRTRPADRASLLSVGRSGRVYLAIESTGRRAARAVEFADGRTVWEWRTSLPVLGARELVNGTVAVSAGTPYAPSRADRLTLLDPP